MKKLQIKLKKLDHGQDLPLPNYGSEEAAGIDLMAAIEEKITLLPGARMLVPCGFSMALPQGFEAQIRPRSGLAFKYGITVLNTPGTIDSDYRGEVKVLLINHGQENFEIEKGMRIAQMVVAKHERVSWLQVFDFEQEETSRGEGGFGSTGLSA